LFISTLLNAQNNTINFNEEELKFIKQNPTIVMGGEMDWAPFDYVDKKGQYQGVVKDYLEIFKERSGLTFQIKTGLKWKELVNALKNKEIDFLPALYSVTDERKKFGIFTTPYLKVKNVMFVRDDEREIKKLQDIKQHKVAVIKGYSTVKSYAPYLDNAKIIEVNSLLEAIYAVLNKQADVLMDSQLVVEYMMNQNLISGLKAKFILSKSSNSQLHMLVRDDKPILHSIIQKFINSITMEDEQKILAKWIFSDSLNLNEKEQIWLEKEEIVKYSYNLNNKPIEWTNELKNHQGIVSDLIKTIGEKSSILFQAVDTNSANMISAVEDTKKYKDKYNFSNNNILTLPYVYVSRLDEVTIDKFKQIKNKKIGIISNKILQKKILSKVKDLKVDISTDYKEGFEKLEDKTIDLLIVNSSTAKYYINNFYEKELKITGKTGLNYELKVAILKSSPQEILSIIDKSIEKITTKEFDDIVYKWTNITVKKIVDWELILKIVIGIVLIILAMLYWNRTMAKEIAQRKKAELDLNNALDELNSKQKALADLHKHTKESIEYASLIQGALIPDKQIFEHFFQDHFALWEPKDILGGDIYLMHQVNEDEVILMLIDCTGHGVPGAFVTMLVKAIERQLMANIDKDKVISPAKILSIFNRSIKHLLKQENIDSVSNAGFDGGVIYYNKKEKIIKFAGAETALFYIENDEVKTIKGSRHSIGYKKSNVDFEFKEHLLHVKDSMQFYCSTDGYFDQNGGEKGFPFGKKKFGDFIINNKNKEFAKQKELLLNKLIEYQNDEDRNDDVTIVGFRI